MVKLTKMFNTATSIFDKQAARASTLTSTASASNARQQHGSPSISKTDALPAQSSEQDVSFIQTEKMEKQDQGNAMMDKLDKTDADTDAVEHHALPLSQKSEGGLTTQLEHLMDNMEFFVDDGSVAEPTMIDTDTFLQSEHSGAAEVEPVEPEPQLHHKQSKQTLFNARVLAKLKTFRKTTKSLAEALDYVPDVLGKLLYDNNADIDDISDESVVNQLSVLASELSARTTSVAFAGIAAHDISDRLLANFLSEVLERQVLPPRSKWLIERDAACQQELRVLHSHVDNPSLYTSEADCPCMFGDIMQFYRPELQELVNRLSTMPQLAVETLASLLMERRAVKLHGHCLVHNKFCKLTTAARHSAGSVCTPYSAQGLQMGLADPSVLLLLCWSLCVWKSSFFVYRYDGYTRNTPTVLQLQRKKITNCADSFGMVAILP